MSTDNNQKKQDPKLTAEEYLSILTGQIRSKKARFMVGREIQNHIEDQIAAYQDAGMTSEEAAQQAIRQMGDPVSVGIDMDRIHRPRAGWKIIGIILLISILGLWAQYFFFYRFADDLQLHQALSHRPAIVFLRQCQFTLMGFAVMILIYLTDYSILGKYGRQLGILFLSSLVILCQLPFLPIMNGSHWYLKCIMYLFVPLFGGILYQYRNTGLYGIAKSLLWLLAAFFVGVKWIGGGLGITLDMVTACYILMLLAIKRGWFSSSKKIPQILTAILPPALACLWQLCNLAPYQLARIQVHLHPDEYASEGAFLLTTARRILSHLSLSGSGWKYLLENQQLPMQQLPGVSYDFIVLQIASIGGIASAALLILVLGLFYLYLTRMVIRQKNQLGQLTGIGCVMVLILETVRNLLNNFGFYTMSTGGFPFLSYGRSHTIMLYALLGVLLSIYRYQDLIWETKPARSSEGSLVLLKLGNCRLRLEWMEKPKRPEKLF